MVRDRPRPAPVASTNHMYEIAYRYTASGTRYPGIVRTKAAKRYHDDAVLQLRTARPSGWDPEGQVRVVIEAELRDDIDADNIAKVLLDALQTATSVNDRSYLPCWKSKTIGSKEPLVRLTISDEGEGCHCGHA